MTGSESTDAANVLGSDRIGRALIVLHHDEGQGFASQSSETNDLENS